MRRCILVVVLLLSVAFAAELGLEAQIKGTSLYSYVTTEPIMLGTSHIHFTPFVEVTDGDDVMASPDDHAFSVVWDGTEYASQWEETLQLFAVTGIDPGTSFRASVPYSVLVKSLDNGTTLQTINCQAVVSEAVHPLGKEYLLYSPEYDPDTDTGGLLDEYGSAVAVYGDWMAVGAPLYSSDSADNHSGTVYIYRRVNAIWSLHQTLEGYNLTNEEFGHAVSMWDGLLAVSSSGTGAIKPASTYAGNVHVYQLTNPSTDVYTWSLVSVVSATEADSNYGYSIAVSEYHVAVGAYGQSPNGAVFLYPILGGGSSLGTATVLSAPDGNTIFGACVDLDRHRLAVLSIGPDPYQFGFLYQYDSVGGTWSSGMQIDGSGYTGNDLEGHGSFVGHSVAVAGSYAFFTVSGITEDTKASSDAFYVPLNEDPETGEVVSLSDTKKVGWSTGGGNVEYGHMVLVANYDGERVRIAFAIPNIGKVMSLDMPIEGVTYETGSIDSANLFSSSKGSHNWNYGQGLALSADTLVTGSGIDTDASSPTGDNQLSVFGPDGYGLRLQSSPPPVQYGANPVGVVHDVVVLGDDGLPCDGTESTIQYREVDGGNLSYFESADDLFNSKSDFEVTNRDAEIYAVLKNYAQYDTCHFNPKSPFSTPLWFYRSCADYVTYVSGVEIISLSMSPRNMLEAQTGVYFTLDDYVTGIVTGDDVSTVTACFSRDGTFVAATWDATTQVFSAPLAAPGGQSNAYTLWALVDGVQVTSPIAVTGTADHIAVSTTEFVAGEVEELGIAVEDSWGSVIYIDTCTVTVDYESATGAGITTATAIWRPAISSYVADVTFTDTAVDTLSVDVKDCLDSMDLVQAITVSPGELSTPSTLESSRYLTGGSRTVTVNPIDAFGNALKTDHSYYGCLSDTVPCAQPLLWNSYTMQYHNDIQAPATEGSDTYTIYASSTETTGIFSASISFVDTPPALHSVSAEPVVVGDTIMRFSLYDDEGYVWTPSSGQVLRVQWDSDGTTTASAEWAETLQLWITTEAIEAATEPAISRGFSVIVEDAGGAEVQSVACTTMVPPTPTPFSREAVITNPVFDKDAAALEDGFGSEIAVYGDWMVVPASYYRGSSDTFLGRAYVYKRVSGVWVLTQTLEAPTLGGTAVVSEDNALGQTVAMNSSLLVLSVTADNDDETFYYMAVYSLSNDVWTYTSYLEPESDMQNSYGAVVTMNESFLVVSAPEAVDSVIGRAYVYPISGGVIGTADIISYDTGTYLLSNGSVLCGNRLFLGMLDVDNGSISPGFMVYNYFDGAWVHGGTYTIPTYQFSFRAVMSATPSGDVLTYVALSADGDDEHANRYNVLVFSETVTDGVSSFSQTASVELMDRGGSTAFIILEMAVSLDWASESRLRVAVGQTDIGVTVYEADYAASATPTLSPVAEFSSGSATDSDFGCSVLLDGDTLYIGSVSSAFSIFEPSGYTTWVSAIPEVGEITHAAGTVISGVVGPDGTAETDATVVYLTGAGSGAALTVVDTTYSAGDAGYTNDSSFTVTETSEQYVRSKVFDSCAPARPYSTVSKDTCMYHYDYQPLAPLSEALMPLSMVVTDTQVVFTVVTGSEDPITSVLVQWSTSSDAKVAATWSTELEAYTVTLAAPASVGTLTLDSLVNGDLEISGDVLVTGMPATTSTVLPNPASVTAGVAATVTATLMDADSTVVSALSCSVSIGYETTLGGGETFSDAVLDPSTSTWSASLTFEDAAVTSYTFYASGCGLSSRTTLDTASVSVAPGTMASPSTLASTEYIVEMGGDVSISPLDAYGNAITVEPSETWYACVSPTAPCSDALTWDDSSSTYTTSITAPATEGPGSLAFYTSPTATEAVFTETLTFMPVPAVSYVVSEPMVVGDTFLHFTAYDSSDNIWNTEYPHTLVVEWQSDSVSTVWNSSLQSWVTTQPLTAPTTFSASASYTVSRQTSGGEEKQSLGATVLVAAHATPFSKEALVPLPAYALDQQSDTATIAMDGEWMVVGEPMFSTADLSEVGVVHLYRSVNGVWVLQGSAEGTAALGHFGQAISMHDGLLAVAAPEASWNDGSTTYIGEVTVFRLTGSTWVYQEIFNASVGGDVGYGDAVAINADHLVVGATEQTANGTIYMYAIPAAGEAIPLSPVMMVSMGSTGLTSFGGSISLDGDRLAVVGDGPDTALTSASFWEYADGSWGMDTPLSARIITGPKQVSLDGDRMAISGMETAITDPVQSNVGVVRLFQETSPGVWVDNGEIEGIGADDFFGSSISLYNSDYITRVAVTTQSTYEVTIYERDNRVPRADFEEVFKGSHTTPDPSTAQFGVGLVLTEDTLAVATSTGGVSVFGPSGYSTSIQTPASTAKVADNPIASMASTILGVNGVADGKATVVFGTRTSAAGAPTEVASTYAGGSYSNTDVLTVAGTTSVAYVSARTESDTCHPRPKSPIDVDTCMYYSAEQSLTVLYATSVSVNNMDEADTTVVFTLENNEGDAMEGSTAGVVKAKWSTDSTYTSATWSDALSAFTVTLSAPGVVGSYTVDVTVDGVELSDTISVTGPPTSNSTISPSPVTATAGVVSDLTVTLKDSGSNTIASSECTVTLSYEKALGQGVFTVTGTFNEGDSTWTLAPTFEDIDVNSCTVDVVGCGLATKTTLITPTVTVSPGIVASPSTLDTTSYVVGAAREFSLDPIDSYNNDIDVVAGETGYYACLVGDTPAVCTTPLVANTTTGRLTVSLAAPGNTAGDYAYTVYSSATTTTGLFSKTVTFTPGPVSNTHSYLDNTTFTAGASVSITLAVCDEYDNGIPGKTVTLGFGSASAAANPMGAGSGTGLDYVTTPAVSVPQTAGANTVYAIVSGVEYSFSVTINPGPISNTESSISTTSFTVGATVPLTLSLCDQYGNGITGKTVAIGFGSQSAATIPMSADSGDGLDYSVATLSVPTVAAASSIYAVVGGVPYTFAVTIAPGPISLAHSSLDKTTFTAGSSVSISLAVCDQYGNGIPGKTVAIGFGTAAAATNPMGPGSGSGLDYATTSTVSVPQTAGATSVYAIVSGVQYSFSVTINPGPISNTESSISTISFTAGASVPLTLGLRDQYGNGVTGKTVVIGYGSQAAATVSMSADSGSGLDYSVASLNVPTVAGASTIYAMVDGVPYTFAVTIVPGPISSTQSHLSQTTFTAGDYTSLTLAVCDQYGNGIPGKTVTIGFGPASTATHPMGPGSGTGLDYVTPSSLSVPQTACSSIVSAIVSGDQYSFNVTINPGPISNPHSSISSSTFTAGSSVPLTLALCDQYGNGVTGRSVKIGFGSATAATLTMSAGSGSGLDYSVSTLNVPTVAGSSTVYTMVSGVPFTFAVTIIPGPISNSASSLAETSFTAAESVSLTLALCDEYGNGISGKAVTIGFESQDAATHSMGAGSGTGLDYTVSGVTVPSTSGSSTVYAVTDGTAYTFAVTITAAAASTTRPRRRRSTVFTATTVTVEVEDDYGNAVSGVSGVTGGFSSVDSSSTGVKTVYDPSSLYPMTESPTEPGVYSITLTTPTTAGSATFVMAIPDSALSLSLDGPDATKADGLIFLTFDYELLPGDISATSSSVVLSNTLAGETASVSLTLVDQFNNGIPDETVALGFGTDVSAYVPATEDALTTGLYLAPSVSLPENADTHTLYTVVGTETFSFAVEITSNTPVALLVVSGVVLVALVLLGIWFFCLRDRDEESDKKGDEESQLHVPLEQVPMETAGLVQVVPLMPLMPVAPMPVEGVQLSPPVGGAYNPYLFTPAPQVEPLPVEGVEGAEVDYEPEPLSHHMSAEMLLSAATHTPQCDPEDIEIEGSGDFRNSEGSSSSAME
ncbi:hypothetical protein KIPB_002429 [Kipferlia bialata]|uniref:Uncharacterized protein n=1 Tax=Kipferlia bialata TaxID=797122 RepID=A0A9K3CTT0_9EUKA|nr:hypothetical protein KIPB_002429 [Kipferlia bialata]|eukprot:g2429.t1